MSGENGSGPEHETGQEVAKISGAEQRNIDRNYAPVKHGRGPRYALPHGRHDRGLSPHEYERGKQPRPSEINHPNKTLKAKHKAERPEYIDRSRLDYQPNAKVQEYLDQADRELIQMGWTPPSDEVKNAQLAEIEQFANNTQPHPEKVLHEADSLAVVDDMLTSTILTLTPMPKKIKERLKKNPESQLKSKELTTIYKNIKSSVEKNPELARMEDLSDIINSEIATLLNAQADLKTKAENPLNAYNDPAVKRLSDLTFCADAIDIITKGKKLDPTSTEARMLDKYLLQKIEVFSLFRLQRNDPQQIALADACIAYFDALKNNAFEKPRDKKPKAEKVNKKKKEKNRTNKKKKS